jgi:hypothetical protein
VYLHPNPCQSQSLNWTTHTKLDNRTQLYMSFNQMSACKLLASMNNLFKQRLMWVLQKQVQCCAWIYKTENGDCHERRVKETRNAPECLYQFEFRWNEVASDFSLH